MRNLFLSFLFLIVNIPLFSQDSLFDIGILRSQTLKSITITVQTDGYSIYSNDSINLGLLKKGDQVKFTINNDSVQVASLSGVSGVFSQISLVAQDTSAWFKLKSHIPLLTKEYDYPSNVKVRILAGALLVLNNVYIQHYLPGVVYAEAGGGHLREYYKVQAIISRTYARSNGFKHEEEGFNLCDGVHCQAYRGKITGKKEIPEAVLETNDIVVIDSELNLISATFSSNCGGQTANSEQVWSKSVPYLRSVKDSYCTTQPSAYWKKEISQESWLSYLKKYKLPVEDSTCLNYCINFQQPSRQACITSCNQSVYLKNLRTDMKLKSTFFSVTPGESNTVILSGRGFGHGVGLCQEGAMKMSKLGFTYEQILKHYFTGVTVVKYNQIKVFKEE
jgi:stage II sporulation protein D